MPAIGVKTKQAIGRAARCGDDSILDAELMNEAVGIDVVEAVALRNVGGAVGKNGGEVRVFPVKVDEICAEMPLLKKVAGAGEIVGPGAGLFRPGLIPVEPLAKRPESQARSFPKERLVGGLVDHDAIDAVEKFLVGGGL